MCAIITSLLFTMQGLVDMMVQHVPSSKRGAPSKVSRCYSGPQDSELATHMRNCNHQGPLVVHVAKLFPKQDCSKFDAFGRILSGTLRPGDKVSKCFFSTISVPTHE